MPTIYVIAGPHGAGKTTFAFEFLPDYAQCVEFLNAELIEAKANGHKIVIWRDGQVVETYVDEIPPLDERDIPPPALRKPTGEGQSPLAP